MKINSNRESALICKECNKKFKTNGEASKHSIKTEHHEYKLEGTNKVELSIV